MAAVPWLTDWPSPSQVQVLAAGGMCLTSSSMYSRPGDAVGVAAGEHLVLVEDRAALRPQPGGPVAVRASSGRT